LLKGGFSVTTTIQNRPRTNKVRHVENSCITPDPTWFEAHMRAGFGRVPFPGWAVILNIAEHEHVSLRREGGCLHAYEVVLINAYEFWGVA